MSPRLWIPVALVVLVPLLVLLGSGCRVALPFRGPGFDAERGRVRPEVGETVLVVVTEGRIGAGRRDAFSEGFRAVREDLDRREGLVGASLRRELFGPRVWTLSAWRDRAALAAFLGDAAHAAAVDGGSIAAEDVRFAYAELPASELPLAWSRAEALLVEARGPDRRP